MIGVAGGEIRDKKSDNKEDNYGFQYYFNLLRPTSEGRVWIDSADPMAAPTIRARISLPRKER